MLIVVSAVIAVWSAPSDAGAVTARDLGVDLTQRQDDLPPRRQPGEWLEHAPLLTILLTAIAFGWLVQEFTRQSAIVAISNLNTYNLLFLMLGLLLHWRPKRFLDRGRQIGAGDDRRADPVPVLRRHQLHPHHGREPGRRHALARDRRRLRAA